MTNQLFAPFSKATIEVFKLMMDLDASLSSPEILKSISDADDKVNICIGITGDLSGKILYRFPKETALEIVKSMSGMDISEIDEFVTSALSEIANIISGNAVTGLSEQQIACDILPPQVLLGNNELLSKASSTVSRIKMESSIGEVELNIMIN